MTYNQANITQQRTRTNSKRFRTSDLPAIGDKLPQENLYTLQDYVNAFIVNEAGEVLVFEGNENGRSWASWQMIGRELNSNEDPMLAIQQDLLERTGYSCVNWLYLGSFVADEKQTAGAGHFFCATSIEKAASNNQYQNNKIQYKWVNKKEIRQALLDGRIAKINHAVAVSLAMVMCNHQG